MPGPLEDAVLGVYERAAAKAREQGKEPPEFGAWVDLQASRYDAMGDDRRAMNLRALRVQRQAEQAPQTAQADAAAQGSADVANARADARLGGERPMPPSPNGSTWTDVSPDKMVDLLESRGISLPKGRDDPWLYEEFAKHFGAQVPNDQTADAVAPHLWKQRAEEVQAKAELPGDDRFVDFSNPDVARSYTRDAVAQMDAAKKARLAENPVAATSAMVGDALSRGLTLGKVGIEDLGPRGSGETIAEDVAQTRQTAGPVASLLAEGLGAWATTPIIKGIGGVVGKGLSLARVPAQAAAALAPTMTFGLLSGAQAAAQGQDVLDASLHGAVMGAAAHALGGTLLGALDGVPPAVAERIAGAASMAYGASVAAAVREGRSPTPEELASAMAFGLAFGHRDAVAEQQFAEMRAKVAGARMELPSRRIPPVDAETLYRGTGRPVPTDRRLPDGTPPPRYGDLDFGPPGLGDGSTPPPPAPPSAGTPRGREPLQRQDRSAADRIREHFQRVNEAAQGAPRAPETEVQPDAQGNLPEPPATGPVVAGERAHEAPQTPPAEQKRRVLRGKQNKRAAAAFVEGQRAQAENRRLEDVAYTDAKTGLRNQSAWEAAKARETAEGRGLWKWTGDLGEFKGLNDSAGHSAGDRALRKVADVMRAAAKEAGLPERNLFRSGGDEFSVTGTQEQIQAFERAMKGKSIEESGRTVHIDGAGGMTFEGADARAANAKGARKRAAGVGTREQEEAKAAKPAQPPTSAPRTPEEEVAYRKQAAEHLRGMRAAEGKGRSGFEAEVAAHKERAAQIESHVQEKVKGASAIEFTDESGRKMIASGDPRNPGKFRVTSFTEGGEPSGHVEFGTLADAARSAMGLSTPEGPPMGIPGKVRITSVKAEQKPASEPAKAPEPAPAEKPLNPERVAIFQRRFDRVSKAENFVLDGPINGDTRHAIEAAKRLAQASEDHANAQAAMGPHRAFNATRSRKTAARYREVARKLEAKVAARRAYFDTGREKNAAKPEATPPEPAPRSVLRQRTAAAEKAPTPKQTTGPKAEPEAEAHRQEALARVRKRRGDLKVQQARMESGEMRLPGNQHRATLAGLKSELAALDKEEAELQGAGEKPKPKAMNAHATFLANRRKERKAIEAKARSREEQMRLVGATNDLGYGIVDKIVAVDWKGPHDVTYTVDRTEKGRTTRHTHRTFIDPTGKMKWGMRSDGTVTFPEKPKEAADAVPKREAAAVPVGEAPGDRAPVEQGGGGGKEAPSSPAPAAEAESSPEPVKKKAKKKIAPPTAEEEGAEIAKRAIPKEHAADYPAYLTQAMREHLPKPEKRTIRRQYGEADGKKEFRDSEAEVYGPLALVPKEIDQNGVKAPGSSGVTVIHVETGLAAGTYSSRAAGKEALLRFLKSGVDWSKIKADETGEVQFPEEEFKKAISVRRQMQRREAGGMESIDDVPFKPRERRGIEVKDGTIHLDEKSLPDHFASREMGVRGQHSAPRVRTVLHETPPATDAGRKPSEIVKSLAREGFPGTFDVVIQRPRRHLGQKPEVKGYGKDETVVYHGRRARYLLEWIDKDRGLSFTLLPEALGLKQTQMRGVRKVTIDVPAITGKPAKQSKGVQLNVGIPLPNFREMGKAGRELWGDMARITMGSVDRMRSWPGHAAKEVAEHAERIIDNTRKNFGEMQPALVKALKASGAPVWTRRGRAVVSLQRPHPVPGKKWARSRTMEILEGRQQPRTRHEERITEPLRALILRRGRMFEAAGLQQHDPATGTFGPFRVHGTDIAPRIASIHLYDVWVKGPAHKAWNDVIDAFSEASGVHKADVEKDFRERHESINSEGPEALLRRTQAEFKRNYPEVPAYVRIAGEWVPMFEVRPFTYARLLAERGAARLGFSEEFGMDPRVQERKVEALRKSFALQTGRPKEFVEMMRMLHGMQATPPLVDPSSWGSRLFRASQETLALAREGLLSASAIPNLAEPVGALRDIAGTAGLARAWVTLTKAHIARMKGKASVLDTLELMGAITRDVVDVSLDPTRPLSSLSRAARDAAGRVLVHRTINEWQEKLAAVIGLQWTARMRAGKGTRRDVQRLLTMRYGSAEARRLARGGGTLDEYLEVIRRTPAETVGATTSRPEQSWLENRRWVKALIPFTRYASTIWRSTWRQAGAFMKGMREAHRVSRTHATIRNGVTTIHTGDPVEGFKIAASAAHHLAQFLIGKTLQGTIGYFLAALATGGTLGAKVAWEEFKDHPAGFLADSLFWSLLSGPYGSLVRAITDEGDLASMILPVWVGRELWTSIAGTGAYRDMALGTRLKQLFKRTVPVNRVFETGLVAMGFGNKDAYNMETARRAYWRWRYAEGMKPGRYEAGDQTGAGVEFRTAMKAADRAVRDLDPEEAAKQVETALGIRGKEARDAAASIRAHKVLDDKEVRDRLDELRSRIGEEAYEALEVRDELLERYATAVSASGRKANAKKALDVESATTAVRKRRRILRSSGR